MPDPTNPPPTVDHADLPARARELSTTIAGYLARLDDLARDDYPDGLAVYGRREIHAGITRLMRREGVGLLGELAGEVEQLVALRQSIMDYVEDLREQRDNVRKERETLRGMLNGNPVFGRPLTTELRADLNSRSNWDGDDEHEDGCGP